MVVMVEASILFENLFSYLTFMDIVLVVIFMALPYYILINILYYYSDNKLFYRKANLFLHILFIFVFIFLFGLKFIFIWFENFYYI